MKVMAVSNTWIDKGNPIRFSQNVTYRLGLNGVQNIFQTKKDTVFSVSFEDGTVLDLHDVKSVLWFFEGDNESAKERPEFPKDIE